MADATNRSIGTEGGGRSAIEDEQAVIEGLQRCYRSGRTASAPGTGGRWVHADDLLSAELDLGGFDNPVVLAFMAIYDPFEATAVAALARLAPQSVRRPRIFGVIAVVHRQTRHQQVRVATTILLEVGPTREGLKQVLWVAEQTLDAARQRANAELSAYLDRLATGTFRPPQPLEDLQRFAYAMSLETPRFRRTVLAILESPKVAAEVRIALVQGVGTLSQDLAADIIACVGALPPSPDNDRIRQALAESEAEGGSTDPQIRPWTGAELPPTTRQARSRHPDPAPRQRPDSAAAGQRTRRP